MKNKFLLLAAASALLSADVNADNLSQGREYLKHTNYLSADLCFSNAVASSPQDPTVNVFWAITRVLTVPDQPAGSNFLNRLGVASKGRVLGDWTAKMAKDSTGFPEVASGMNFKEAGQLVRTNVIPILAAVETNLALVTDTNFQLTLSASETRTVEVTLDYGDILMARAMAQGMQFGCYYLASQNADVLVSTIENLVKKDQLTLQYLLNNYSKVLTFNNTSDMPAAKAAFQKGVDLYLAASEFIRNRPTNVTRLFNFDPEDASSEQTFRHTLSDLAASLSSPTILTENTNYTVSASKFFAANYSLRSFLPTFTNNAFIYGSLPDPTFGGIITGLSRSDIEGKLMEKVPAELVTPGVTLNTLCSFTNGWFDSSVIRASDGNLYGFIWSYNDSRKGTLFKVTPQGNYTALVNISEIIPSTEEVSTGQLLEGPDSNLYGFIKTYSSTNYTTSVYFFKATRAGALTLLYSNTYSGEDFPENMILGKDNLFYGSSYQSIFSMTTNGQLSTVVDYWSKWNVYSIHNIIQCSDGNLVGISYNNLFKFTAQGNLIWSTSFPTNASADYWITGAPIELSDGKLMGVVNYYSYDSSDESPNTQQLFVVDLDGKVTMGAGFDKMTGDGYTISLVKASDNGIYGSAYSGGGYDYGSIFKLTDDGEITPLVWFDGENGRYPMSIFGGNNGVFYGVTGGDESGDGVTIYQFSTTSSPVVGVTITSGLQNQSVSAGSTLNLSVTATGTAPLSYQWYFNNVAISGQTGTTLTVQNVQSANAGAYKVVVSNSVNSATSSCTIAVLALPIITVAPQDIQVAAGSNVVFSVTATGNGTMKYQWYFNGAAVKAATKSSLTLSKVTVAQAGTYSVVVSNAVGGVTASAQLLVVPPVPAIKTASGRFYTNPVVTGTAVAGVSQVVYSLNGGLEQAAVGTTNWSIPNLVLVPGTNILAVRAVSGSLYSSYVTRGYTFVATTKLVFSKTGNGTIKPALTNGQTLEIGTVLSLTATPNKGWLFSSWGGSVSGTTTNLTLPVTSNITLTVEFVKNPYATNQGTYNGILSGVNDTNVAGFFTMTLTTNASFSYQLLIGQLTYRGTGQLNPGGTATTIVSAKGGLTLTNYITLNPEMQQVFGMVDSGAWQAELVADWAVFNKTNKATGYSGSFTFVGGSDYPAGIGCGTVVNSDVGDCKITAYLSDDTAVAIKSTISKNGRVPAFSSLYKGKGYVCGWLVFNANEVTGSLKWLRTADTTAKIFQSGFTNSLAISGAPYVYVKTAPVITATNSLATLDGGNLTASITNYVAIDAKSSITVIKPVAAKLTLKLAQNTGLITGTFIHDVTKKQTTARAVILQPDNSAYGYFIGTNNSGLFQLTP